MFLHRIGGRRHDAGVDFHNEKYVDIGKGKEDSHGTPNMSNTGKHGLNEVPNKAGPDHACVVMQGTKQSRQVEHHTEDQRREDDGRVLCVSCNEHLLQEIVFQRSLIVLTDRQCHENDPDETHEDTHTVDNDDGTAGIAAAD